VGDASGTLWITSYNGLFGCSRQVLAQYERGRSPELVCRWFSVADGLDNRACSGSGQPVASQSADGRLWFSNLRSLAVFDPRAAPEPPATGELVIEEVDADGAAQPISPAGVVRVPSSARHLEFHYTSPSLSAHSLLRFRYRLQGFDEDWNEAGARRVAYYSKLPPGHYQFEVMVGRPGGNWQGREGAIALEVLPRFYERRWVQVTSGALTLGLGIGAVLLVSRARLRRRLLWLEMKQATERERRRIAQDLHDDLGGSLTEIGLLAAAAEAETAATPPEARPAAQVRAKADALVRTLDEIVWAVNPRHDTAASLAEYLSGYAQEFLEAAGVRTRVSLEGDLTEVALTPEQRHGLFLAAKEALTNVVRHAQATTVRLEVRAEADKLAIGLEDDGCGFDPAGLSHQGDGLRNLRERLVALGGGMELRSAPGKGTLIQLRLALKA
jgi:signal transduction histidine kinase